MHGKAWLPFADEKLCEGFFLGMAWRVNASLLVERQGETGFDAAGE